MDDDVLVEVVLPHGVVVRYVDHRFELRVRICLPYHSTDALHHQAAVAQGELHAVVHLVPVLVSLLGLHRQEGHVDFRSNRGEPAAVHHLRLLVVEAAHLSPEVAGAGVYHHPEGAFNVFLKLDEVVAASESADLLLRRLILAFHNQKAVDVESLRHLCLILGLLVMVEPEGNLLPDSAQDLLAEHLLGDVLHLQGCLHGTHPASYVNTHRVRDDDSLRGENTAYGHPLTSVHIRHEGQVMEDERKVGEVHYLLHRVWIHVPRPYLHGRSVQCNLIHSSSFLLVHGAKKGSKCAAFLRTFGKVH